MANPINCNQASLLLTKEKHLFYYKLDLHFSGLYFNDFALCSSFCISTVNRSRKVAVTSAAWFDMLLSKHHKNI